MIFPTANQSSKIMRPGEQPLRFPSAPIPSQHASILGFRLLAVRFMRYDKLGSMLHSKASIQWITAIGFITNHAFWRITDNTAVDCGFHTLHFAMAKGRTEAPAIAVILTPSPCFAGPEKWPPFLRGCLDLSLRQALFDLFRSVDILLTDWIINFYPSRR